MMTDLEKLAVQTAMKKLFDNGTFFYNDLESCLKICGVVPDGRVMQSLRVLHCVPYRDMPKELLSMLPDIIIGLFKGVVFDTDRLNIVVSGNTLKLVSNRR